MGDKMVHICMRMREFVLPLQVKGEGLFQVVWCVLQTTCDSELYFRSY